MNEKLTTRPLGRSGLQVTPLGLAAQPVSSWGRRGAPALRPEDVEQSFHEHGINTFLVHPSMQAQSEGVRRLVRAGHRDALVLASEASLPLGGSVRRALDKQLRALGTDHLDVWLMGWVRGRWYLRDSVWQEMTRSKERGLARALGFSAHDRVLAASLARELPIDVLMIRYNAAHRGAEREIFAALSDLGERRPGIIAYTATRWGALLAPLPERGFPQAMTGPECYRFVLGHPMVDTTWCAARTREELREDVDGVLTGPLDEARHAEVRRFGDSVHQAARGGPKWMFGQSAE
jgi:aryl-alcohol dehydrogenase-like predicted oxidoreductase